MLAADRALERARRLHAEAAAASNRGDPKLAIRLLTRGEAALSGVHDDRATALAGRMLITRGWCESELNGWAAATPFLEDAERLCAAAGDRPGLAMVHAQWGTIHTRAGRFPAAVDRLTTAAASPDLAPEDRPNLLLTLGTVQLILGNLTAAVAALREAQDLARRHGAVLEAFKALHNLGYLEFLRGNLPGALARMNEAAGLGDDLPRGIPLLDRARVLAEAGLLREADEALEEAGEIFARARLVQDLAEVELSRAECALFRGEPATARRFAVSARRRFRTRENLRWLRHAELVILGADLLAGRHSGRMLATAQALAEQLAADGHHSGARMAALIGAELRLASGNVSAARSAAATARPQPADPIAVRLHARFVQAQVALRAGDPAAARRAVRTGLADLDRHRARFGSLDMRTAGSVHGRRLVELDVALALAEARPPGGGRRTGRVDRVIAAAERGRAVASRLPAVRPPRDDETAQLLGELRRTVDQLEAVELDGAAAAALRSRRHVLERRVAARAWTRQGQGAVQRPVSLAELRAAAEARDTAVVYFVAAQGRLHAVRTGTADTRLESLGPVAPIREVARRVRADLDALAQRTLPGPMRAVVASSLARQLKALDDQLLAPLRLPDSRLVVVTTGALSVLPWPLLPSLRGIPVEVAPSASVWHRAATSERDPGPVRVTAVSGPGLHRAEQEVSEVAARWSGAQLVCRDRSTCPELTSALGSSTVLHIAAHGRHSLQNPLFSSLRLNDGPVFAHELEDIGSVPEHVVLSACELGVATIRPGDEPLGLSSVLLQRGTRSVVAGVAAVGDDVACDVMVRYHDGLAGGHDSARALADALREVPLDTPAPFTCFGAAWAPAG